MYKTQKNISIKIWNYHMTWQSCYCTSQYIFKINEIRIARLDRYGSVDWTLFHKAKGHWFNSQSGHMPRLWVGPLLGHVPEATN